MPRERTGHSKHPLSNKHKRRLYTWTSPDGQHRNQNDYILCSQRWQSSIQSAKTRPGADCGSDHELLIAKFRLKLKTVGKTTRPFRYDLNQIPYKCWRRLLRVSWTARRSNQSILKISPGISLEGMMLKLKLQYFGHLM